jgi:hypothetical protein
MNLELEDTLTSMYSLLTDFYHEWYQILLHPYESYVVCGKSVYSNPYSVFNDHVFVSCSIFLVMLLLLVRNKQGSILAMTTPALSFVMFHNIFDFICSLPQGANLFTQNAASPMWYDISVSMGKRLGIEGDVVFGYIDALFGGKVLSWYDGALLMLRTVLLVALCLYAISPMFSTATPRWMHVVNVVIVAVSSYMFCTGIVEVLCKLGAHYSTLVVAGPLLPAVYLALKLVELLTWKIVYMTKGLCNGF